MSRAGPPYQSTVAGARREGHRELVRVISWWIHGTLLTPLYREASQFREVLLAETSHSVVLERFSSPRTPLG